MKKYLDIQMLNNPEGKTSFMRLTSFLIVTTFLMVWAWLSIKGGVMLSIDMETVGIFLTLFGSKAIQSFAERK